MKFLSVCSGIEAASVAWGPLGWKAWAFSEFDKNPSLVLAHHYPDTPNFGDMTKYEEWPDANIDLLCGGTPCQSFSLSGLRKGLADPRGDLMLTYGAIANRYRPQWLVWENVPGVLSSNGGRDFGAFLGLLEQLGYGFAYRVLDAQHFGVPQRRERVFVVGHLGAWQPAAAVLFERDSLRRLPKKIRSARGGDTPEVAPCVIAQGPATSQAAPGDFFIHPGDLIPGTFSDRGLGGDYRPGIAGTMKAGRQDYLGFSQRGLKENGSWQEGMMPSSLITSTLTAMSAGAMVTEKPAVFSVTAGFIGLHRKAPNSDVSSTPAAGFAHTMAVHSPSDVRAFNHHRSARRDGDDQVTPAPTVGSPGGTIGFTNMTTVDGVEDGSPTQRAGGMAPVTDESDDVRKLTPLECELLQGFWPGYTAVPTKKLNLAMKDPAMFAYQKRVLAHLNFTDDQLMRLLPDSARYKALGNSWAVPNAQWVGMRIQMVQDVLDAQGPRRRRVVLS